MVRCLYRNSSQISIGEEGGAFGRQPRVSAGFKNRSQISFGGGDEGASRSVSPTRGGRATSPLSPSNLAHSQRQAAFRATSPTEAPWPPADLASAARAGGARPRSPERLLAERLFGGAVPPALRTERSASGASLAAALRARHAGTPSGRSRGCDAPPPRGFEPPPRGPRAPASEADGGAVAAWVGGGAGLDAVLPPWPFAQADEGSRRQPCAAPSGDVSRRSPRTSSPRPSSPPRSAHLSGAAEPQPPSAAPVVPPLALSRVASGMLQRPPAPSPQVSASASQPSLGRSPPPSELTSQRQSEAQSRCAEQVPWSQPSMSASRPSLPHSRRHSDAQPPGARRAQQEETPGPRRAQGAAHTPRPWSRGGRASSCTSPGASGLESFERRVRGSLWEGPAPPERAGNLHLARGSQALPSGRMEITGTTQGDLFKSWRRPDEMYDTTPQRRQRNSTAAVLPEGRMRFEGTTNGEVGGMYTFKGFYGFGD